MSVGSPVGSVGSRRWISSLAPSLSRQLRMSSGSFEWLCPRRAVYDWGMHVRPPLKSLAALPCLLLVGAIGCGGATQFAGAQPIAIAGTPPPPPPPAPPPKPEPPKPPPRVELRDNKIEFKEKIQF